jgi:ribosomal protein L7/L12
VTYEDAITFVMGIRPRLAVADADRHARQLLAMWERSKVTLPDGKVDWARVVLADEEVMSFLRAGKKIQAIKEVRCAHNLTLKEAKDAVEDPRVWTSDIQRAWEAQR